MARYKFPRDLNGITKDALGRVLPGVTVSVFLTGTTTPAIIYETETSVTQLNSVISDEYGSFAMWFDDADYLSTQGFDITFSLTLNGVIYTTSTSYNVKAINTEADLSALTIAVANISAMAHVQNTDTGTENNAFYVGDETDSNIYFYANNSDVNKPYLRYNAIESAWYFCNDGSVEYAISAPGSTTFATEAEAIAGIVTDKSMAPDTTKAAIDAAIAAIPDPPAGAVTTGLVVAAVTGTVPDGYLECNGASLLRATYADLFTAIGTTYGFADATHFYLPDYRGQFLRGWAHGQTTDPDKATRTNRGDGTAGDNVGTKQTDQYKGHNHSASSTGSLTTYTTGFNDPSAVQANGNGAIGSATVSVSTSIANSGGNETRPTNINVMWCIKY